MIRYFYHNFVSHAWADKETPHSERYFVELRDPVDEKILKAAVKQGMRRYPYYAVELRVAGNRYAYFPNSREFPVANSELPLNLLGKEANFHCVAFRWWRNRIYFDFDHGLIDGIASCNIIKTIVYCYCRERYSKDISSDGIRLSSEGMSIPPEEYEDPMLKVNGKRQKEYFLKAMSPEHFQLPETRTEKLKPTAYRIEVDADELMNFSSSSDGSPNSVITAFLNRAISSLNPDAKTIRTGLCCNFRKYLGAPDSGMNLSGVFMLPYIERMKKYSVKDQITLYKGMITACSYEDNMMKKIENLAAKAKYWSEGSSLQENIQRCRNEPCNPYDFATATVSYCGKSDFGPITEYMTDFSISSLLLTPILVEITFLKNKFLVDFIQKFEDPKYFNAFLEEFDANGIRYRLKSTENASVSVLDIPPE